MIGLPVRATDAAKRAGEREGWITRWSAQGHRDAKVVLDQVDVWDPGRPPARELPWTVEDGVICFVTPSELAERIEALEASGAAREMGLLRDRVAVTWNETRHHDNHFLHSERTRPYLVFSGKLELWDRSGVSAEPLTWLQGVRVLIEKVPGSRPDWHDGFDGVNTLSVETVVDEAGAFEIHVEPWKLQRFPGEVRGYQVAICLPDMEPGGIWRNVVRPLPQSMTALRIPGPAVLSPTLALINASPRPIRDFYDPVALVRAVNHLHSLGKDAALAALREYASVAPQLHPREDIPAVADNLDTADAASIFFIVRLLFEPESVRPCPSISSRMMGYRPQSESAYPGGLYPLVLSEDIPFLMAWWLKGRTGSDSNPFTHIDWAERHGRLRSEPLRPADDPTRVAEALASLPGLPPGDDPRQQVRRAIGRALDLPVDNRHVLRQETLPSPPGRSRLPSSLYSDELGSVWDALPVSDEEWKRLVEESRVQRLRWDEELQRYVGDARVPPDGHDRK